MRNPWQGRQYAQLIDLPATPSHGFAGRAGPDTRARPGAADGSLAPSSQRIGREGRSGQQSWPGRSRVTTNRRARQRVKPLPKGNTLFTPNASPARLATERQSARPLLFLHQLPTWVLPVVLAILLVAGLAVRGPGGAVALCAVAAVLGWLASVSWPRLTASGRAGRLLAIAVAIGVAAYQAAR
jgi:hypothetical protein